MTDRCRLCGRRNLHAVFTLPNLPLGHPVPMSEARSPLLWSRDLEHRWCAACGLGQTAHDVAGDQLAEENTYFSAGSRAIAEHDEAFAREMTGRLGLAAEAPIIEIGSGDGSLLRRLRALGFRKLLGVEPAPPRPDGGVPIARRFFDRPCVAALRAEGWAPELIICNYVLELVPDLPQFIAALQDLMSARSTFVLEVPYFLDFVRGRRIDGFAHLRCNWFTVTSILGAFDREPLRVAGIEHDPAYRGGTLRAVVRRDGETAPKEALRAWRTRESEYFRSAAFRGLAVEIGELRGSIRRGIDGVLARGLPLYGYGGGLKASTLLNWLGLDAATVRGVFDNDPRKQGKAVPRAAIPIAAPPALPDRPIAVLNLALDHAGEVEPWLLSRLAAGSVVVHPLPEFRVVAVER